MESDKHILVTHYCKQTSIDDGFIYSLAEYGLIRSEKIETEVYIYEDEISEIERMFRLHHDLGINIEGLDVIHEMLTRINEMKEKMALLEKRLGIYE